MSGTQGLIVVGAHTRLGYVHYLAGRYDDAIREYHRELTFLIHAEHALRERSVIEVQQKLAAAYEPAGRLRHGGGVCRAGRRRLRAATGRRRRRSLHALLRRRARRAAGDVDGVLTHLARPLSRARPRSPAGACRAIPTSPACSPIRVWRRW